MLNKSIKKVVEDFVSIPTKSVGVFGIIYEGGRVNSIDHICYIKMSYPHVSDSKPEYVFCSLKSYDITDSKKSMVERYIDYIMNRSPHSVSFVDRDARECIERGYVLLSADQPSNLLVCSMIAIRMSYEKFDSVVRVFNSLVDGGVEEGLAYVLSNCVTKSGIGGLKVGPLNCNHTALYTYYMSMACVKNYMEGVTTNLNPSWIERSTYSGIGKLFMAYTQEEYANISRWSFKGIPELRGFIESNYKRTKKELGSSNPFKMEADYSDPKTEGYDDCIKNLIEFSVILKERVYGKE